jgi:hypothetical protein
VAARARLGSPGWSPTSPTFHSAALHELVRSASPAARPRTPIVRLAAAPVRTSSPAVRPASPERPTSVHGRPMAVPRRAVERNRIYRRLQQDLHVIDARSVIEKDPVKRKMWDIEDENEDDDEDNKRARRE